MMNVVPASNVHEHLGPVVPVDTDESSPLTLQVPGGAAGTGRRGSSGSTVSPIPTAAGSGHKLIGASDEHHILTTPGGQRAAQLAAASKRNPPKFSVIVNEYVGACFEDNCNIGEFILKGVRPKVEAILRENQLAQYKNVFNFEGRDSEIPLSSLI